MGGPIDPGPPPTGQSEGLQAIKSDLDELDIEVRGAADKQIRAKMSDVEQAFTEFYGENAAAVYRATLLVTRDRALAEEATTDAFMRAFANWSRVSEMSSPRAWLIRVARNSAIDHYRRSMRSRQASEALHLDVVTESDEQPSWSGRLSEVEDTDEFLSAIKRLPDRQREVLALLFLADLSVREAAHILGVSERTIRASLGRATTALRKELTSSSEG